MRILSLSTLFPTPTRPDFGKFVANQMKAVAALGEAEVTVVNPLGLPPLAGAIASLTGQSRYRAQLDCPPISRLSGIEVHHPRFRLIPRIGGDSNPARIVKAVLPLARRLHQAKRFDLIDAQFFYPDGPAAARIAAELGLPYTIKARGSDIHYWSTRPTALRQMRQAAAGAAGMLAVSGALRTDMVALGFTEEKIQVHYTGLDRARFQATPRAEARTALPQHVPLSLPEDAPLLVTPGALIPIKGQHLVIEALAEIPAARLALAGTGPDENALRDLSRALGLADRVHFLGQVPHAVLPLLMAAADAVVLPSEREGLANVWVEALACGTPLVVPDIGGAREVVRAPSAGRLAERSPGAIAEAVKALLAAPLDQQAVAANVAQFSWEANARALVDFWRGVAGK